jgi:multiple sugar transport system substrate-binding protein
MSSIRRFTSRKVTRRAVVGGAAGLAASSVLAQTLAARKAPAVIQGGGKLTYWGGLIFSDAANQLLTDTINQWGADNGVETEVVMINQNETQQKVSAAVESNTMPSALDLGLGLAQLLSQTGQLQDLTALYDKIGAAQGGWFESIDAACSAERLGGARTGIPFGSGGNIIFRRLDVLEEAGFTTAPATWEEMGEQAVAAQQPGIYGLGLALSNVGDGNLQQSVLQSYGGRIANDEGTECTIKSEETRTYLEWITNLYAQDVFAPGATTWDGAGDNTAYLSGQAIFIANPGSVSIAAQTDDPDLYEVTGYSGLPAGPVMTVAPIGPNVRSIPIGTEDVETASALIEFLQQPEFLAEYYKVAIYGPVMKDQESMEAWSIPVLSGQKDLVTSGTAPGYPDVDNTALADFGANFIVPKMIQRVVVDGRTIDEAMDEAQQQGEAIYAKYA